VRRVCAVFFVMEGIVNLKGVLNYSNVSDL